jgi:hypothetical protein
MDRLTLLVVWNTGANFTPTHIRSVKSGSTSSRKAAFLRQISRAWKFLLLMRNLNHTTGAKHQNMSKKHNSKLKFYTCAFHLVLLQCPARTDFFCTKGSVSGVFEPNGPHPQRLFFPDVRVASILEFLQHLNSMKSTQYCKKLNLSVLLQASVGFKHIMRATTTRDMHQLRMTFSGRGSTHNRERRG